MVLKLWREIRAWFVDFNIQIPADRKPLIFGMIEKPSDSIENVAILTTKYYIWKTRCQTGELNLTAYKKFLKFKLDDLKNACLIEDKNSKFEKWLCIYECLCEGP